MLHFIAASAHRTEIQSSGGNALPPGDRSGVFKLDFNAWIQSGIDPSLAVGSLVDVQCRSRDQQPSFGTSLSNALELAIQP